MEQLIVYIIPLFLLMISVEFAYGWYQQRNTYRLSDAISSLNQGLISQLVALVTQLFQIGLYARIYHRVALFPQAYFWHTALGWISAVLLYDFCDYWLHRMGHENSLMWAAHSVHHQSQDFNLTTALRQESTVVFIGWLFYLPMALIGVAPEQFAMAGMIVLVYQFWIHTEHIGTLGWFDKVFSSPSNHRVHHAVNDQYLDKNYGGMLVIWDRLFGTFAEEKETCVYGTRTPLQSWNPILAITGGYGQLLQSARQMPRWQDKLRIWFKPPGWLPAGMTPSGPAFDLEQARLRYDIALPVGAQLLAVLQFALLLVATAVCLWIADDVAYWDLLLVCSALLVAFWALGAFLQRHLAIVPVLLIDVAVSALTWYVLR